MLRPRTIGKIMIAVLTLCALLTSFIFALKSPDPEHIYESIRSVTYAIMALVFVTAYRYFED